MRCCRGCAAPGESARNGAKPSRQRGLEESRSTRLPTAYDVFATKLTRVFDMRVKAVWQCAQLYPLFTHRRGGLSSNLIACRCHPRNETVRAPGSAFLPLIGDARSTARCRPAGGKGPPSPSTPRAAAYPQEPAWGGTLSASLPRGRPQGPFVRLALDWRSSREGGASPPLF